MRAWGRGAALLGASALAWAWALAAPAARAALPRPLEGSGDFASSIDVLDRRAADGTTSVVLLIAVANRDLHFQPFEGHLVGRLGVVAELAGNDGAAVRREAASDLRCDDRDQAGLPTLYQILPVVLPGVKASRGTLSVRIEDRMRERPGLLSRFKSGNWLRSEAVHDWAAGPAAPAAEGLSLGDPVFLAQAPIGLWSRREADAAAPEASLLTGYLHPNRRYGLEQTHLQVYFELQPPPAGARPEDSRAGIRVEAASRDMAYAVHDTIPLGEAQVARLAAGGTTGVFYDLDLADLPPGSFTLTCAPANARGWGWAAEFDVVWSLASLNRFAEDMDGEARTVLYGGDLARYEAATQTGRAALLEKFWAACDPDPATPVNETRQEFLRRLSYVRQQFGGMNRAGAVDARGRIYLLLGAPDEVQKQVMPLNSRDMADARVRVFDAYAPVREGENAKNRGGIALDVSRQAQHAPSRGGASTYGKDFELWIYNQGGRPLFTNAYSGKMMDLRFLFVDRTGSGGWILSTSNSEAIGTGD